MANNYNQDTVNKLQAIYVTARANFVKNESYFDRAIQFVSDDRLALPDADVVKATTAAAAGDFRTAVVNLTASIESVGYVGTLPSYDEEAATQFTADVNAVKKVAVDTINTVTSAATSTGKYILYGIGGLVVVGVIAVVLVKRK